MAVISNTTTIIDAGAIAAGSGAMTLIKTLTLSNAATASFVNGASSVVLNDVPPHVSVAGVPAKVIGMIKNVSPALGMDHNLLEMREYESGGGI